MALLDLIWLPPSLLGTLTLNKLSVDTTTVYATDKYPTLEILKFGALSANTVTEEPIDVVLMESYPHAVRVPLTHFTLLAIA